MKKELLPSVLLTLVCAVFFCVIYPAIVWGVSRFSEGKGEGVKVVAANGKVYYENIAQKFTDDKYFWSRPSAVDYHADGAGGSNKGPSNPDYLATVQERIDTFLVHNPGVNIADIPSDLVTASGAGLDPNISVQAALVQVARIAKARAVGENVVKDLVTRHIEKPLANMFGTEKVNVLKLNIALDQIK